MVGLARLTHCLLTQYNSAYTIIDSSLSHKYAASILYVKIHDKKNHSQVKIMKYTNTRTRTITKKDITEYKTSTHSLIALITHK